MTVVKALMQRWTWRIAANRRHSARGGRSRGEERRRIAKGTGGL